MKKILLVFCFIHIQSLAQNNNAIILSQISWTGFDTEGSPENRFELKVSKGALVFYTFNCIGTSSGNGTGSINPNHTFNYNYHDSISPFQHLFKIHGWEDDGCGDCNWDPSCDDDDGGTVDVTFDTLLGLPPQKYHTVWNTIPNGSNNMGAVVQAKYAFPNIDSPLIYRRNLQAISTTAPPIICPHDTLYFKTDYKVLYANTLMNGNKTGIKFKWELNLNGGIWKIADTTLDSTFKFVPKDLFPEFDTLAAQGNIYLRTTALGMEGSKMSNTSVYTMMPRAPRATVVPFASCPGQSNGKVDINFINGIGSSYRYILKNGFNQNTGCDPDSNNCFTGQASSGTNVTAPNYTIPSIGAGQYTLWLINEGGYKGSCFNTYNVEVTNLPNFNVTLDSSKDVSCKGGNDGGIFLHSNNTFPVYNIESLVNAPNASYIVQDTIFKIQNLKKGTYSVRVKDYCNVYTNPIVVTITEPTRVIGSILQAISPTCISPANGSITVEADSGSGSYNYLIYKSGVLIASSMSTSSKTFQATNLSEGSYKIEVQDALRPSCIGYIEFVTLSYPSTMILYDSLVALSCHQSSNGEIILTGSGNTSGYRYSIFDYNSNAIYSNTSGKFSGLNSGYYKEILKRNNIGCLDSMIRDSVFVSQPSMIATTISKKNVSCLGNDDGFVTVSASGGTPSYTYQWEFKNSSGWSGYFTTGNPSTITQLYPAEYRARVVDGHGCIHYSDSVDVREPNALQIDSLQKNNIVCFGQTANIHVYASGGNSPYTYSYSLDNGGTYTQFTSTTGLYSGSYKIKVTDANGCSVVYPIVQEINSSSQPLQFSYQLSDYHGYNVSCKYSSNGSITLIPRGGNDHGYIGYEFSLNNASFNGSLILNNLAAGIQNVRLKDGRGCIVAQDVLLKEPDELTSNVSKMDTLKCGNDTNGVIVVSNNGGAAPFVGRILGNNMYLSNTTFANLKVDGYQFEIKDANGCLDTISSTMTSKYPKLHYNYVAENVKCHGGNSASITLNPSGGVAPYVYQWFSSNFGNTPTISNIPKSVYNFEIKDGVDCSIIGSVSISEPAPLEFTVDEVPVCPSTVSGEFRIHPSGGTKPYLYSIDSNNFSTDAIIENIFPSTDYRVTVRDSNQCSLTKNASISVYDRIIKPDFLVSTRDLTTDRLRAVDISRPKPDSIWWTFSSNTNVIQKNNDYCEVKYDQADQYTITMRTFHNLCENVVTKKLNIQVKDTNYYRPYNGIIDSFDVFPNPSNGNCNLYLQTNKVYPLIYLQINNNLGTKVFDRTYTDKDLIIEPLDLTTLSKGTYYLRVYVENEYRIKVIIIE